jgi:hypothetical protein
MLRNNRLGLGPPRDGLGPLREEARPPGGPWPLGQPGGPDLLPGCRHVPLRKLLLNQRRHVSGGFLSSARSQPNYRIKCGWLGCACLRQGMGCLLTRWACMADITVSPPVTEAARHVTAPRAWARGVWLHHSAAHVGEGLL